MEPWGGKVSTCLYIDKEVLETARLIGLNISRASENGLIGAIARLSRPKPGSGKTSF
jgi:post-segregation antitoxin (ccd killing protein)